MASFGGSVKLTGESEYRKALKEITSNLKLVSSELKLTNTEFSNGDKSVKQTKSSYDNMSKTLQDQKSKVASLKEELAKAEKEYGSNNEKVQQFKTQLNNAEKQLKEMENATDKSTKELKNMKQGFDDAGKGALSFGDILKANVLGDVVVGGLKKVGSAVAEIGKSFIGLGKQALDGFAEFEQLEGGVKKLFGDEASNEVISNANNAFRTAGMSANEYMDTVTSFSASLISSLKGDTEKATSYADRAIQDMSDNANTFGTDINMIQSAYQGFAKSNYTMLDNLKLGYGGTKTEMERLLSDASKISGIKYDISSFADITEAIHIMQEEMHIAGTTSKEAGTTIEGSVKSMKSAWNNLLTGLATDGANLGQLIDNFMTSIFGDGSENNLGILGNALPAIDKIINSFSNMIPNIIQKMTSHIPELLQTGMNMLQNIINGINSALPQLMPIIQKMVSQFAQFVVENLPTIINAGIQILLAVVQGIAESLPELIPAMVDAIITIVDTLIDNIDLLVDAGIQLILGLADGLIEAIPRLIEKAPEIIQKLVDALIRNTPKLVQAGGELIGKLVMGIIGSVYKLLEAAPELIKTLVKGLQDGFEAIRNVGKNLVEGLWKGINDMTSWVLDKIKGFGQSILDGIKSFFGIHSPSTVFRDQIGENLALGIGEGFSNTMKDVSKDMNNSIPTQFDISSNISGSSDNKFNLMKTAFMEAFREFKPKVILNGKEIGEYAFEYGNIKYGSYYN